MKDKCPKCGRTSKVVPLDKNCPFCHSPTKPEWEKFVCDCNMDDCPRIKRIAQLLAQAEERGKNYKADMEYDVGFMKGKESAEFELNKLQQETYRNEGRHEERKRICEVIREKLERLVLFFPESPDLLVKKEDVSDLLKKIEQK